MMMFRHDRIIVLDFGSQYTHLIVRRIRELGVYTEIHHHMLPIRELEKLKPKGIILSGGPQSVYTEDALLLSDGFLKWQRKRKLPVLGICYGMQLLSHLLDGKVKSTPTREYGLQTLTVLKDSDLLKGMDSLEPVWMSHGDQVEKPPRGFRITATTPNCSVAAFENSSLHRYGVQFHPEVHHTLHGIEVLRTFIFEICHCKATWQLADFINDTIAEMKHIIEENRVIMGVSGGVDSTVAASLLKEAIGDQLHCVFVDNGLLRSGEAEQVQKELGSQFLNFHVVDASDLFLQQLQNISDPEKKRQIIATTFIEVFQHTAIQLAQEFGPFRFLGQGTIAPDRIESGATSSVSSHIKSHHNVSLPDTLKLEVVEPLQLLYKDEVRKVGNQLGLPSVFLRRHPFPGPALAVRIIAPVTKKRLRIVREADVILLEELEKAGIYEQIWQAFTVYLPIRSVGVMGDARTYEYAIAIRIVESIDAMTARIARLDWTLLERIASRIINEVQGVNRVLYDLSNKPPATIEFL